MQGEFKLARKKLPESEFMTYKNKPFVRSGDTIYYGNMSDPYVIKMEIKSKKEVYGQEVADIVNVELLNTDETLSARRKVKKKAEREGLYLALDLAEAWLEKAVNSEE